MIIINKNDNVDTLASFFKILGNTTRINILLEISKSGLCVEEISEKLNMTQSAISHQLKLLKANRLVKSTKKGKFVYYTLDDQHIVEIIENAFNHINHS